MTPLALTPVSAEISEVKYSCSAASQGTMCSFFYSYSWIKTSSNSHCVHIFFILTFFFFLMLLIIPQWRFLWNVTEGIYFLIFLTLFCTLTHIYSKDRDTATYVESRIVSEHQEQMIRAHIRSTLDSCFSKGLIEGKKLKGLHIQRSYFWYYPMKIFALCAVLQLLHSAPDSLFGAYASRDVLMQTGIKKLWSTNQLYACCVIWNARKERHQLSVTYK